MDPMWDGSAFKSPQTTTGAQPSMHFISCKMAEHSPSVSEAECGSMKLQLQPYTTKKCNAVWAPTETM
eukprot:13128544-Alexandrium_andersonii.AAC.1